MPPPFLADTNVYIAAAHDPVFAARFEDFRLSTDPLTVSTVVLSELMLGSDRVDVQEKIVRALTAGVPAQTPTGDDWLRAASAIAQLGGELVAKSRSFWNDAILAAQCERLGVTIVTANTADFRRLGRYVGAGFVAPFPRS